MLKKRVIPVLLLRNERMVKGKQFRNYIDTGDPASCAKVYSHQDADEIIFLDINEEPNHSYLVNLIRRVSKECFIPLTVGGNINSIEQIRNILKAGADKISINTYALENRNFIKEASKIFGTQCIVVSIDVRYQNNIYTIYSNKGKKKESITLEEYIKFIEDQGAGEILINSIDRDGMMTGYDEKLIRKISQLTSLPIIALGGAEDAQDILDIFEKFDISAVACASLFHFRDNNPLRIKSYLKNHNINLKRV